MRIQIKVDGASTAQIRDLAAAMHAVCLTSELTIGLDGPELWNACTPMLTPGQHAVVVARLVKFHGVPVADVLDKVGSPAGW